MYIFVYGTLRTNYAQIGNKITNDRIKGLLFDLGGCPGFLAAELNNDLWRGPQPTGWVVGEVIEIDPAILPTLDQYEGVDRNLYTRMKVTTEKGYEVWVYMINPSMCDTSRLILSGDWHQPNPVPEAPTNPVPENPA